MCLFILFASSNLRVKPKLGFEKKPLKCLLEETIPIPNPFGPKIMTSGESSRDDEFRSSNLTISPPSKQQKVRVSGVEETLDRLSELPDSLLVPILSLLPTEDAFATCILSKRTLVQDNLQKVSCATELTIGTWFTESDESLCKYELKYLARGDNIDLQSWISSFVFPNLKKVKIVISSGVCLKNHFNWGFDKLFKLSEFLLKRATVLEKFVLISKRRKCKRCSMNCVSRYLFRMAEKLLGCPRSSTNFLIIFQE
nr:putative FBD-associated F-box protein At1g50980 isoform X2 [Nicotiana tomentosiformis]